MATDSPAMIRLHDLAYSEDKLRREIAQEWATTVGAARRARDKADAEVEDLRRQLAHARIFWLTLAMTGEPEDPAELVDWLRGRRTYYEKQWKEAQARIAELESELTGEDTMSDPEDLARCCPNCRQLLAELDRLREKRARLRAVVEAGDTLARIQAEQGPWVKHNFGDRPAWMPVMGLAEEVGELSHAVLKREQGIRMEEGHSEAIRDALADIIIFACDVASAEGFDLREALDETWGNVKQRDWAAAREAAKENDDAE